ncbi:MAG: hypothetical protein KC591_17840, partial [Gemmatimonadetes bacterium]|nr:hypothetical protein [Gemmatimonadota bacterium]
AQALERTRELADDGDRDDWAAGATCTVLYHNTCTGWVFNWSGWAAESLIGQVVDTCCPSGSDLLATDIRVRVGSPSGYGFTGSIAVSAVDANDCPTGSPIFSQPYLPEGDGWQLVNWGVPVPSRFVVWMTLGPADSNPVSFRTDHPSVGPSGPEACGTCYPGDRVNHSFTYGTATSPTCPGSPFDDPNSACDAELQWEQHLACSVSVEDESWSKVKSLYR